MLIFGKETSVVVARILAKKKESAKNLVNVVPASSQAPFILQIRICGLTSFVKKQIISY